MSIHNRPQKAEQSTSRLFSKKEVMGLVALALAFAVVAMFIAFSPMRNAQAAGATITISPTSRAYIPPDSVIGVTGAGYIAHETIKISWNYSGPGTGTLEGSATANASGGFTFYFTTPLAPTGTYTIAATGQSSGALATGTFRLLPGLTVTTEAGGPGTAIQITGNAFGAGETVKVTWNGPHGPLLATATGDSTGSFTVNSAVPTGLTLGTGGISITGVGQSSHTTALYKFTFYAPTLALAPVSGTASSTLILSAYGFKGGEQIKVYWNTGSTPIATGTTDLHGYLAPTATTIPAGTQPGSYLIKVVGQSTHITATNTFTVVAASGKKHPVSSSSSTTNWGNFGFGPAVQRNNVVETTLSVSNVAKLQLKWSATIGSNNLGSPSPVYANGTVYIATLNGFLNAYNATTGALQWQYNTHTGFPNLGSPLVDPAAGLVFFGSLGHQNPGSPSPFYAVDIQTHTLKWSVILPCNEFGEPSLAFNTIYIGTSLQADTHGTVYALDETTGKVNWHYTTVGGVWRAIGADTTTNTVFATAGDPGFTIQAFNATTGAVRWTWVDPNGKDDLDIGSGIPIANGFVYANGKDGFVYALHENDGTLAWSRQIAKISVDDVSSPAIASDGTLYVGSRDGFLYALNGATGAILWKASGVGAIDSSPAIANGVIYFASLNNKFYAVNQATGAVLWSYTTGNKTYSSPIVVNGWFYCASTDGKLYAFSL